MLKRYQEKETAYTRRIEALECDEAHKLHIIQELIERKLKKIAFNLEKFWIEKINFISRNFNDVEVLEEIKKDIINNVSNIIWKK